MPRTRLLALGCALALLAAGCGKGPEVEAAQASQADFTSSLGDDDRLVRPPNVIAESEELLLEIKGSGGGRLLPEIQRAQVRSEGTLRWLEVDAGIEESWQVLRDFWQDQGFGIEIELPEAGFIETSWQQDRSQVLGTGLSRYLDIALDVINDTGVRHKFRSRIEPGDAGGSSIFISHQVIEQGGIGTDGEFTRLPSDPILEVEMLRRLLIAFRLPEESIATLQELAVEAEDNDLYDYAGSRLTILRDYDESWRLLGVALDRSGFTVLDRDRETGTVTLLLADPTLEEEEWGFFRSMFGQGQEGGEPREVLLTVAPGADQSVVSAPDGEEGETIISIIASNL